MLGLYSCSCRTG